MTAEEIYNKAFVGTVREKRSVQYRRGVIDALSYKFGEKKYLDCPFTPGTADCDAWIAGMDEGKFLYKLNSVMAA